MMDSNQSLSKDGLKFFLGYRVKQLRGKLGLSLKELAKKSGLSSSYLNEIEKGKKFPKLEKLTALSAGLKTSVSDLMDLSKDKSLKPVIEMFEKGIIKKLPLEIFGLGGQDLYEIISQSQDKFGAFLRTFSDLATNYDMNWEQFHRIVLRAYQENNRSYFPELEEKAKEFRRAQNIDPQHIPSKEELEKILAEDFNYQFDEVTLGTDKLFSNVRGIYKKGIPNKFLLNPGLMDSQKKFVLAKEIGFQLLKLDRGEEAWTDSGQESFEDLFKDFTASYLAGAILLDSAYLEGILKELFAQETFSPTLINRFLQTSNTSSELMFHRIVQLLPNSFGMEHLFFLRFERNEDGRYRPSKELHIGRKHSPHGIGFNEHYCRRWITVSLPQRIQDSNESVPIVDAQRSIIHETGEEYLCLSLARPSRRKPMVNISVTIGIQIDQGTREKIKFIDDPNIPVKTVGNTCERCSLEDCDDRAHEANIHESYMKKQRRKDAISRLFSKI